MTFLWSVLWLVIQGNRDEGKESDEAKTKQYFSEQSKDKGNWMGTLVTILCYWPWNFLYRGTGNLDIYLLTSSLIGWWLPLRVLSLRHFLVPLNMGLVIGKDETYRCLGIGGCQHEQLDVHRWTQVGRGDMDRYQPRMLHMISRTSRTG